MATTADVRMCGSCGENPPRSPGQSYCARCHSDYQRRYRERQTNIMVDRSVHEAIRAEAKAQGVKVSKVWEAAAREYLDARPRLP